MAVAWRKSTASGMTDCVEVGSAGALILIRDSKEPRRAPLAVSPAVWHEFLAAVRDGELDQ